MVLHNGLSTKPSVKTLSSSMRQLVLDFGSMFTTCSVIVPFANFFYAHLLFLPVAFAMIATGYFCLARCVKEERQTKMTSHAGLLVCLFICPLLSSPLLLDHVHHVCVTNNKLLT